MTVRDWVEDTSRNFRRHGLADGTRHTAKNSLHSVLGRIDPHVGGWNIYDDEWDLSIVLDACRADLLAEVADEFGFLPPETQTRRSLGTATRNWMQRTFTEAYADEMSDTSYVVANAYSELLLNPDDFEYMDEVHRYAWDDELGTVRPRPVTERAVDVSRNQDPQRLLVHYLPPHFPSIPDHLGYNMQRENFEKLSGGGGVEWNSVWDALSQAEVSSERVWTAYRENLRYVLDDVRVLLNNVDAERAIITSDHGNAFGEWWTYGHPPGVYVPVNRRVPFVEVTATDEETLKPTLQSERGRTEADYDGDSSRDIDERLAALGYK